MDPEGNKIELWEPNDSCFEEDGGASHSFDLNSVYRFESILDLPLPYERGMEKLVVVCGAVVIWGSSFFFMKHSMFTPEREPIFSNTQVASIRMLVASSILVTFGINQIAKNCER
jgi:hypothetical protein